MPQPWEKYAAQPQAADGPWSKYGQAVAPPQAPEDDRNGIQKSFDEGTHYEPNDPLLKKVLAGTAHGIGAPFIHPIDTAKNLASSMDLSKVMGPNAPAPKPWAEVGKELPYDLGEAFGNTALTVGLGGGAAEGMARIPSRSRAVAVMNDIEQQGHGVPVEMIRTPEALGDFQEHVDTGGKGDEVMSKLQGRIGDMERGPINFPEARKFYTNVSDVTRKPGMLRRVFEDSKEPRLRAAAGPVREALNSDIIRAADTFGRGEDLQHAMKEYAQNAAMRGGLKKAATAAAPIAASAIGARKIHDIASSVLR